MLVLTRGIGERIVIGGNIEIKVISVRASRVRIGVLAPDSARIVRKEIEDRDRTSRNG